MDIILNHNTLIKDHFLLLKPSFLKGRKFIRKTIEIIEGNIKRTRKVRKLWLKIRFYLPKIENLISQI